MDNNKASANFCYKRGICWWGNFTENLRQHCRGLRMHAAFWEPNCTATKYWFVALAEIDRYSLEMSNRTENICHLSEK